MTKGRVVLREIEVAIEEPFSIPTGAKRGEGTCGLPIP
jgi:hypothetical protein